MQQQYLILSLRDLRIQAKSCKFPSFLGVASCYVCIYSIMVSVILLRCPLLQVSLSQTFRGQINAY